MTKIEALYNLYSERPNVTAAEAAGILSISQDSVYVYNQRLQDKGMIKLSNGPVEILKPYRVEAPSQTYKAEIYREMIDSYLDDFRAQTTFADRLSVGREIRLLLERM